jgi:hypothetical protein
VTLVKIYFLVALLFSPLGEVRETATHGVYKDAQSCEYRRIEIIEEPPRGLPDSVGLTCVEVEIALREAKS